MALQNNFTTIEQSKRLLELLPADSADCYIWESLTFIRNNNMQNKGFFENIKEEISPCWSVGRLIEIYKIVGEEAGQCISCSKNQTQVESLVQLYEENIGLLDFSKLEE